MKVEGQADWTDPAHWKGIFCYVAAWKFVSGSVHGTVSNEGQHFLVCGAVSPASNVGSITNKHPTCLSPGNIFALSYAPSVAGGTHDWPIINEIW